MTSLFILPHDEGEDTALKFGTQDEVYLFDIRCQVTLLRKAGVMSNLDRHTFAVSV